MEYNREQYEKEAYIVKRASRYYNSICTLGSSLILCFIMYTIYVLLAPLEHVVYITYGYCPIILVAILIIVYIILLIRIIRSSVYKSACDRYEISSNVYGIRTQLHKLTQSYNIQEKSVYRSILFTIISTLVLSFSATIASSLIITDDAALTVTLRSVFSDYSFDLGMYGISLDSDNRMIDIVIGSDGRIENLELTYILDETEKLDAVSAFLKECEERFSSIGYSYNLELPQVFIDRYDSDGTTHYSMDDTSVVGIGNRIYYNVYSPSE